MCPSYSTISVDYSKHFVSLSSCKGVVSQHLLSFFRPKYPNVGPVGVVSSTKLRDVSGGTLRSTRKLFLGV